MNEIIALITWNSSLVPVIGVYSAQIHIDLSSRFFQLKSI